MKLPLSRATARGSIPRFLMAGGLATLCHWLVMLCLLRLGLNAMLATGVGATAGLLVNYLLQHRYAFRSDLPHPVAFPRYLLGSGLGWVLNLAGFSLLLMAGAGIAPSQIIATGLVALANYLFAKRFVFHEAPTANVQ